jgi:hypothetical protein
MKQPGDGRTRRLRESGAGCQLQWKYQRARGRLGVQEASQEYHPLQLEEKPREKFDWHPD